MITQGAELVGNTAVVAAGASLMQANQSRGEDGHIHGPRTFIRPIFAAALGRLRSLSLLQWWQWGEVIGAAGLIVLAVLLVAGHVPHPAAVAILVHIAADFTFQSAETVSRKTERGHHLLVHALAAGGLPLAIAGLISGNPLAVLSWMAAGAASHYAVDWTRKFGLRRLVLAVALDQGCHALTILALGIGV